jgi:nitronate monooxygenase
MAFLRSAGIEREVPLIAAGGIRSFEDIARLQGLGAAAVQLGTPFAVTSEGDASELQARAGRPATRTWSSSPAWPACRRVRWPRPGCAYLKPSRGCRPLHQGRAQEAALHLGLRLPGAMRACATACPAGASSASTRQLAAALRGDVKKGLFFRGVGAAALRRLGQIR